MKINWIFSKNNTTKKRWVLTTYTASALQCMVIGSSLIHPWPGQVNAFFPTKLCLKLKCNTGLGMYQEIYSNMAISIGSVEINIHNAPFWWECLSNRFNFLIWYLPYLVFRLCRICQYNSRSTQIPSLATWSCFCLLYTSDAADE